MTDHLNEAERSTAHLADAEKGLHDTAVREAQAHSNTAIDHEVVAVSAGTGSIKGEIDGHRHSLIQVQLAETLDAKASIAVATGRFERAKDPENDILFLDEATSRDKLPLWGMYAALGGFVASETWLLNSPINEALASGEGLTLIGVLGGATLAVITAGLAHVRSHFLAEADTASDYPAESATSTRANLATLGVFVAGGAAVFARIYGASVGQDSIDGMGVAFFVMLQMAIVLAALSLPGMEESLRRRAGNRARRRALIDAAPDLARAQGAAEALPTVHDAQRAQLAQSAKAAVSTYVDTLAAIHPSSFTGDHLRYNAAAIKNAGIAHLLDLPTDPPGDMAGNNARPAADPPAPSRISDGEPQRPSEPTISEPETSAASGYQTHQELYDDLLDRRTA